MEAEATSFVLSDSCLAGLSVQFSINFPGIPVEILTSEDVQAIADTTTELLIEQLPQSVAVHDSDGKTPPDYSRWLAEQNKSLIASLHLAATKRASSVRPDYDSISFMWDMCGATIEIPGDFSSFTAKMMKFQFCPHQLNYVTINSLDLSSCKLLCATRCSFNPIDIATCSVKGNCTRTRRQ